MKDKGKSQNYGDDSSVPMGYKKTEVGVIPEDWEVKSVRQIGDPVRGGSPRPAGDPRFFNGSYMPWLTVAALTNIPASQLVVADTATCLTEEGSHHSRTLFPGTLIIANSGATLGVSKILGIKCCANDGIAALLNINKDVSSEYLAHFINTKTTYLREVVATGNGQPNLNTDLIGRFNLPLPPTKAEQEAIAGALSDVDALIESMEQLIAKKRHIKQGTMQELLTGKKRLPGFQVKPGYKKTEVGVIPEDWGLQVIGGIITKVVSGRSHANLQFGDYPVYGSTGIIGYSNHSDYAGNAVLIARVGANAGKLAVVDGEYGVTDNTIMVTIHNSVLMDYFWRQLEARRLNTMVFGSGQPLITGTQIKNLTIPLPPTKTEQEAIAMTLSDMDAEITALESKLTKTRAIKQGMMHNLLTGKIRLVKPEKSKLDIEA